MEKTTTLFFYDDVAISRVCTGDIMLRRGNNIYIITRDSVATFTDHTVTLKPCVKVEPVKDNPHIFRIEARGSNLLPRNLFTDISVN